MPAAVATDELPELAREWAFFLDIDGTLVEPAARPDAVHVPAATRSLLERLHAGTRGALALITGRALRDMDLLFHPLRLPGSGQHGVERRDAAGRLHLYAPPDEGMRWAAERVGEFAARHAGLIFEDKGHNLALHFRLAPEMEQAVRALMQDEADALGPDFDLLKGKMVYELKPRGRDKGVAIEDFLGEPPFAGRVPVFIGDDVTDEHGFEVVNQLGGHTVKVGEGESLARWRVAGPGEVCSWLEAWLARYGK